VHESKNIREQNVDVNTRTKIQKTIKIPMTQTPRMLEQEMKDDQEWHRLETQYGPGLRNEDKSNDKFKEIYSTGVEAFGKDFVVGSWFSIINQNYPSDKYLWISVGSGNGLLEATLVKQYRNFIMCIDPKPHHYSSGKDGIMPRYHTVKEYLTSLAKKRQGQPKKPHVLILNWAARGLDYDMESIELLKPHAIIVISESESFISDRPNTNGARFWSWLESITRDKEQKGDKGTQPQPQPRPQQPLYRLESQAWTEERKELKIQWLVKDGYSPVKVSMPLSFVGKQEYKIWYNPADGGGCSMM
jgi:hypothetical protein